MKGAVYLSYYANADKIENCHKVAISRWLPRSIKKCSKIYDSKEKGMYVHLPELSPSENLLRSYKNEEINIDTMLSLFDKEIKGSILMNPYVDSLIKSLNAFINQGNNVAFVCYEKDSNLCHRKIIGEIFKEMGYNIIIK